ncbi:DUF1642 domain-containing protein [Lactococcus petauri]|nr:DUF1642 domain-containing protein [Lactococcus petauri]
MKKFEEELKNGPVMIDKDSVTSMPIYDEGTLISYFNDWVSPEDHQAEIAKLNSKIDWLHGLLDERNEEVLQTVKRLNEAIPELPEFVGKYIEETADPIHEMCAWAEHYGDNGTKCDDPELSKMLDWFGRNRNMFYEAVIKGYTVKEKQFYLKNKLTGTYLYQNYGKFSQCDDSSYAWKNYKIEFTQQEIDSMETGSYEQIEVEE